MSEFSQKEQPRPEFNGEWRTSPIDGRLQEYFPWQKKLVRLLLAQTVIFTLVCLADLNFIVRPVFTTLYS